MSFFVVPIIIVEILETLVMIDAARAVYTGARHRSHARESRAHWMRKSVPIFGTGSKTPSDLIDAIRSNKRGSNFYTYSIF